MHLSSVITTKYIITFNVVIVATHQTYYILNKVYAIHVKICKMLTLVMQLHFQFHYVKSLIQHHKFQFNLKYNKIMLKGDLSR